MMFIYLSMTQRVVSLLLVAVFMYGITFYPLWMWYKLQREGFAVASYETDDMTAPDEMVVKVPMAMPYHTDWNAPRESSGLMEVNGEFYTITSKDYRQDTLYFYCFKNQNAREIFGALSGFVQDISQDDAMQSPNSPIAGIIKLFKKDFVTPSHFTFKPGITTLMYAGANPVFSCLPIYTSASSVPPTPPPQG